MSTSTRTRLKFQAKLDTAAIDLAALADRLGAAWIKKNLAAEVWNEERVAALAAGKPEFHSKHWKIMVLPPVKKSTFDTEKIEALLKKLKLDARQYKTTYKSGQTVLVKRIAA